VPLLELRAVVSGYGPIRALKGVDLDIEAGSIVALIGNNGAGKTTALRTISGLLRPRSGTIVFAGSRIDGLAPHLIVRRGVSHVPEGRGIFARLSVQENIGMGAYSRRDGKIAEDLTRIYDLFPRLRERRQQPGGTLSGGEQQMLAIARALMARPQLLLLDEPSMGLSPLLVETILSTIQDINRQGTTMLLVEQNAPMALAVARYGYVIESGTIALSGPAAELLRNPAVQNAYLGVE
jgi:branched-chain amino acid transport system ATP-binding protein